MLSKAHANNAWLVTSHTTKRLKLAQVHYQEEKNVY